MTLTAEAFDKMDAPIRYNNICNKLLITTYMFVSPELFDLSHASVVHQCCAKLYKVLKVLCYPCCNAVEEAEKFGTKNIISEMRLSTNQLLMLRYVKINIAQHTKHRTIACI